LYNNLIVSADEVKTRAPRNRTLVLEPGDRDRYAPRFVKLDGPAAVSDLENRIVNQDLFDVLPYLPDAFVDLLFVDPPYNLSKDFGSAGFRRMPTDDYEAWIESWLVPLLLTLKPTASVYVCADWRSSPAVARVLARHLTVRSRITWEREKGRGARANWKNCAEDVWFATVSDDFYFDADAVKLKRRVVAPYREDGEPRDWEETDDGNFRLTAPSNLWTDVTVPFWSMSENTDHPTQKPEKLLAKVILASSRAGDFVFDPFLGSGTTAVAAKKLGRRYCGVEIDEDYCLLTEKRLELAEVDVSIQGFEDGVFWDRNARA
jgi:site-specific DNA-methyltransferase (adenine-specific)